MKALENALEPSILAANMVGPKTGIPTGFERHQRCIGGDLVRIKVPFRKWASTPSTNGCSGPGMRRLTSRMLCKLLGRLVKSGGYLMPHSEVNQAGKVIEWQIDVCNPRFLSSPAISRANE
jgi:hypothetical protein